MSSEEPRKSSSVGLVGSREEFRGAFEAVVGSIERVIKGKDEVVLLLLPALLANGHVLLEDVPRTGNTMLAPAIAQSIDSRVNRVPPDIMGSTIFDQATGKFVFREGAVFANVFLVDEVNRATPNTQSALSETMRERRVSVDNRTYLLPSPFVVVATQKPIELAGTFPLPEAQLDRFLLKLSVGYAGRDDEVSILKVDARDEAIGALEPVVDLSVIGSMMEWAKGVSIPDPVRYYIVEISVDIDGTRDHAILATEAIAASPVSNEA